MICLEYMDHAFDDTCYFIIDYVGSGHQWKYPDYSSTLIVCSKSTSYRISEYPLKCPCMGKFPAMFDSRRAYCKIFGIVAGSFPQRSWGAGVSGLFRLKNAAFCLLSPHVCGYCFYLFGMFIDYPLVN